MQSKFDPDHPRFIGTSLSDAERELLTEKMYVHHTALGLFAMLDNRNDFNESLDALCHRGEITETDRKDVQAAIDALLPRYEDFIKVIDRVLKTNLMRDHHAEWHQLYELPEPRDYEDDPPRFYDFE